MFGGGDFNPNPISMNNVIFVSIGLFWLRKILPRVETRT